MLYQNLISNTHTLLWFHKLMRELVIRQPKPLLEISMYSFEENKK